MHSSRRARLVILAMAAVALLLVPAGSASAYSAGEKAAER